MGIVILGEQGITGMYTYSSCIVTFCPHIIVIGCYISECRSPIIEPLTQACHHTTKQNLGIDKTMRKDRVKEEQTQGKYSAHSFLKKCERSFLRVILVYNVKK